MRLKRKIHGGEEYEKYHQKFRNEYKEGVIEDYNSSKNSPCYQKNFRSCIKFLEMVRLRVVYSFAFVSQVCKLPYESHI